MEAYKIAVLDVSTRLLLPHFVIIFNASILFPTPLKSSTA